MQDGVYRNGAYRNGAQERPYKASVRMDKWQWTSRSSIKHELHGQCNEAMISSEGNWTWHDVNHTVRRHVDFVQETETENPGGGLGGFANPTTT